MARLYVHGAELERWTSCNGKEYVLMADGKVLYGAHGRYRLSKRFPGKPDLTIVRAELQARGCVKI
jgi:hypothetical protein